MKKCVLSRIRLFSLLSVTLVVASSYVLAADDNSSSLPAPPVAKKVPKATEINGRELVDNYFWLRDKPNPDVAAYLQAENAYTDAVMKPTEGLQKKLPVPRLSGRQETEGVSPYKKNTPSMLRWNCCWT